MVLLAALLDANVLYPAGLRDFLLRLADQSLYAPLWSADIHAEWIGSVLADRPDLTEDVLERTRAVMDRHFPDAVVTGYSARTAGLDLPDPDDIHVLAAAIEGEADMIVTRNLRDFPADRLAPLGLTAQPPDAFIVNLFDADPEPVLAAVRGHRAALRNPPRTASEHLVAKDWAELAPAMRGKVMRFEVVDEDEWEQRLNAMLAA